MFIRIKDRPNGKKSIQIVESYRRADKVSQKIIRHIGQATNNQEEEELKRLAESILVEIENQRQPALPLFSPEDFYAKPKLKQETGDSVKIKDLREEQRVIEGIGEIFGKLYDDMGLHDTLGKAQAEKVWNEILKACVIARLANPVSKSRTASMLEEDYGIKIGLEKIYRMMDRLVLKEEELIEKIEASTMTLFPSKVDVMFFDVTTLHFESVRTDDLREFGYSKDCKFKESQVVFALVATTGGLPLAYRLFPGNMYEGHTLIEIVKELKKAYEVENVLLVADRAMFNKTNLEYMEGEGIRYIVAAKLKGLPKQLREKILVSEDYKAKGIEGELHWVKEFEHESRRLIVSYSARRAEKDASDRARLIERLLKKVKDGKVKISEVVPNYGTKKYLNLKGKEASINDSKITEDKEWDGLHGVITNAQDLRCEEVLSRYRGLWQIEESFRMNKHDLKMRPVYHWTERRIRAHIMICFLAFAVSKQAVYRLAVQKHPMSFEQLRNELLHVQASLVRDISTDKKYVLPSHLTVKQREIYQVFGIKRSEVPRAMPI